MKKIFKFGCITLLFVSTVLSLGSCSKSESYSYLFRKEEEATNWYLSSKKICTEIPADSVFITGEDAPYYKMDSDGYIYMQVINPGDPNNRPKKNDMVNFRFTRTNIKTLYQTGSATSEGNEEDMEITSTEFQFGNYELTSSQTYGKGIQIPLNYLGYNSEVNLVLRSYYGFTTDYSQAQCIPYAIHIKYFKVEY